MKNKILLGILLTHTALASNTVTIPWDPKPLDPNKTRGQEIIEWERLHPGTLHPLTQQEKDYFKSQGLPIPGEAVTVKPMNSIKMDASAKTEVMKYVAEQKKNGYVNRFSKHAQNLEGITEIAQKEFEHYNKGVLDAQSTHLRIQHSELKMSYKYEPLSSAIAQEVIGFAPESNYVEAGWNGAVEFFKWNTSICAFHEVNIKHTGSSAFFPQEITRHDVNNKLTLVSAEGNVESHYLYSVEWWDGTYKRILECTGDTYSDAMKQDVIKLSKAIDKSR
jgi:hypothetical protein